MRRQCNNHLSKHQGVTVGPLGEGSAIDLGIFRIRGYSAQFGMRVCVSIRCWVRPN
jgi:hypothetical protein